MSTTQRPASGAGKTLSDAAIEPNDGAVSLTADRLEYLADMISELRVMAARAGYTTLAGLLALAYVEARQQGGKGK